MALSILRSKSRQIHAGGDGYFEVSGRAQFNATDASGELTCNLKNVEFISVNNCVGLPAADETISVDEAAQISGGMIVRPASGTLTVTRTGAAKTSGLIFDFLYRGY